MATRGLPNAPRRGAPSGGQGMQQLQRLATQGELFGILEQSHTAYKQQYEQQNGAITNPDQFFDKFFSYFESNNPNLLAQIDANILDPLKWGHISGLGMRLSDIMTSPLSYETLLSTIPQATQQVCMQGLYTKLSTTLQHHCGGGRSPADHQVIVQQFASIFMDPSGSLRASNITDFMADYERFLQQYDGQLTTGEKNLLAEATVTLADIIQNLGLTPNQINQVQTQGYTQWPAPIQTIANALATRKSLEYFKGAKQDIDLFADNVTGIYQAPTYVNSLFDHFPFDDAYAQQHFAAQYGQLQHLQQNIGGDPTKEQQANKLKMELHIGMIVQKIDQLAQDHGLPQQGQGLFDALIRLVDNNFAMNSLDTRSQNIIMRAQLYPMLSQLKQNQVAAATGLDTDAYIAFLLDLFDLEQDTINFSAFGQDVTLRFSQKKFLGQKMVNNLQLSDLAQMKNLPLHFQIDLNNSPTVESTLHELLLSDREVSSDLFFQIKKGTGSQLTVSPSYAMNVTLPDGTTYNNVYLSPKGDVPNNGDPTVLYAYSKPPTQVNYTRDMILHNGSPLIIDQAMEKNASFTIAEKKLDLTGDAINRLLLWYVTGATANNSNAVQKFGQMKEQMQSDAFQSYLDKNHHYDFSLDDQGNAINPESSETQETLYETVQREFMDSNIIAGHTSPQQLAVGTKLLLKNNEIVSDAPPKSANPRLLQWLEVTDINTTTGQISFNIASAEHSRDMAQAWSDNFSVAMKSGLWGDIQEHIGDLYRVPPQQNGDSLRDRYMKLKDAGIADLSYCADLQIDGGAFVIGDDTITHFSVAQDSLVEGESQPITYKVIPDSAGNVRVQGEYFEPMLEDGKQKTVKKGKATLPQVQKIQLDEIMDYDAFLIFIGERQLMPQTKEQAQPHVDFFDTQKREAKQKAENFGGGLIWYSPSEIRGVGKLAWGNYVGVLKKILFREPQDNYNDIMTNTKIAEKMGKLIPGVRPLTYFKDAFSGMQRQHEAGHDGRIRGKINGYVDGDGGWNSASRDEYVMPKDIIPLVEKYTTTPAKGKDRYKACAALLYLMDNGGPYARLKSSSKGRFPDGTWIKMILGVQEFHNFEKKRTTLIRSLGENGLDKDTILDEVVKLELQMIIDKVFGDDDTKKALSEKFGGTLEGKMKEMLAQPKLDDGINEEKSKSFAELMTTFRGRINGEGRVADAAKFLIAAMHKPSLTTSQKSELISGLLLGSLSGKFAFEYGSGVKDKLATAARSAGIPLCNIFYEPYQGQKIGRILDILTGGDFSKKTSYNANSYRSIDRRSNVTGSSGLISKFDSWWTSPSVQQDNKTNAQYITDLLLLKNKGSGWTLHGILNAIKTAQAAGNPSPLGGAIMDNDVELLGGVAGFSTEPAGQNLHPSIKTNKSFYDDPLSLHNSLYAEIINIDRYTGSWAGDPKQINRATALVKNLAKSIPKSKIDNTVELEFYLKKFLGLLTKVMGDKKNDIARIITTIHHNDYLRNNKAEQRKLIRFFFLGWAYNNNPAGIPDELRSAIEGIAEFIIANSNGMSGSFMERSLGSEAQDYYNKPLSYEMGYAQFKRMFFAGQIANAQTDMKSWMYSEMLNLEQRRGPHTEIFSDRGGQTNATRGPAQDIHIRNYPATRANTDGPQGYRDSIEGPTRSEPNQTRQNQQFAARYSSNN